MTRAQRDKLVGIEKSLRQHHQDLHDLARSESPNNCESALARRWFSAARDIQYAIQQINSSINRKPKPL